MLKKQIIERKRILKTKVLEKEIEATFCNEVKKLGGKAYKFSSPNNAGVPDRIVILPEGRLYFVEFKTPGKAPRILQRMVFSNFSRLGHKVHVIDSMAGVYRFLNSYLGGEDAEF